MKTEPYKNTAGFPVDLDDGSQVAPGDTRKIKDPGPVASSHIEAGRLVASSSEGRGTSGEEPPTKAKRGDKT